ncbi:hypothetical protein GOD58_12290 [Sinorhizobium medicae]|nr:hypothetical protein [Sinorhizobium medicae]
MPDLPAFNAIRTAVGTAEETTQDLRRSLPAGERGEALRKILDALARHLSGKEVLFKDALVRLVEDLALILKFPPLQRETGRAFIRRLTGFIAALPMSERLLLEKHLANRSLAQRIAVAVPIAADRRGAMPPDRTPLRSLPLPAHVPAALRGSKTPAPTDLALLQAMLKKTYGGADIEDVRAETASKGAARDAAQAPAEPQRSPKAPANAPPAPRIADVAARNASGSPLEGESTETAATMPESSDEQLPEGGADPAEPSAPRRGEAAGQNGRMHAVLEDAKPSTVAGKAAGAERGAEALLDSYGSDNADDPSRSAAEDDGAPTRMQSAARGQQPPAEALRAIIRHSLASPGMNKSWQFSETGKKGAAAPLLPENEAPARPRETNGAVRIAEAAVEPTVDAASDAGSNASLPDLPFPEAEPQTRGDAAAPQGFARIPEAGLLRELFPFALAPYPPANESDPDEMDGRKRKSEGEAEKDERDDEGERESDSQQQGQAAGGEQDQAEQRPASDAFTLYRKLGDLA